MTSRYSTIIAGYTEDGAKPVMMKPYVGDGFKVYRKNGSSLEPEIVSIGYEFLSFTEMYHATIRSFPNKIGTSNEEIEAAKQDGRIATSGAQLYTAPGLKYKSLGKLQAGDDLLYLGTASTKDNTWYRVYMTSGNLKEKSGWVISTEVDLY